MPGKANANPNVSIAQLNELRRLAYRFSNADLAAAIAEAGIPKDLVPITVGAEVAHISQKWLRQRIADGKIPSWKVGSRHLVSLSRVISKW